MLIAALTSAAGAQSGGAPIVQPSRIYKEIDLARSSIIGYLPELVDSGLERALMRAAASRGIPIKLIVAAGTRNRSDSRMNTLVIGSYDETAPSGKPSSKVTFKEVKVTRASDAYLIIDGSRIIYGSRLGLTDASAKLSSDPARVKTASAWVNSIPGKLWDARQVWKEIVEEYNRTH